MRAPLFDVGTALHILQSGGCWWRSRCRVMGCSAGRLGPYTRNAVHVQGTCRLVLAAWATCCQTPAAATSSLPAAPTHATRNPLPAGNYRVLPSVIEEELVQPGQRLERPGEVPEAAAAEQRQEATRRIDFLLRSKLLAVGSVCQGNVDGLCGAAVVEDWAAWRGNEERTGACFSQCTV